MNKEQYQFMTKRRRKKLPHCFAMVVVATQAIANEANNNIKCEGTLHSGVYVQKKKKESEERNNLKNRCFFFLIDSYFSYYSVSHIPNSYCYNTDI